jgi:hypothetical protein
MITKVMILDSASDGRKDIEIGTDFGGNCAQDD